MSLVGDPIFAKYEERIMKAIEEDLGRKGYPVDDYFIDVGRDGDIRVYTRTMKLPKDEFFKQYLGARRVTLGNMCKLDVYRIPMDED